MGIRFRRPDTPRVLKAAQIVGVTPSELVRLATLEKIDRLGVTRTAILQDTDKARILAASAPQKAIEAQTKTRTNIETFRQTGSVAPSQSLPLDTQAQGMGMKDMPPRL